MKIALAQIDCTPGDPDANCRKYGTYATRAKSAGCSIVMFPEMSDTGYTMPAIRKTAGTWPGPAYDAAATAAAENDMALVCGLSERTTGGIYNSLAFFAEDGTLAERYRKTHLFAPGGESTVCVPGDTVSVIKTHGAVWGLSICFDLRFPEQYLTLADRGATILVNCAAWPAARSGHWDVLTAARAIENQAFFIGVNRAGTDDGLAMAGNSRVIAPDGRIIAQAGKDEELLITEIDPEEVQTVRAALPIR